MNSSTSSSAPFPPCPSLTDRSLRFSPLHTGRAATTTTVPSPCTTASPARSCRPTSSWASCSTRDSGEHIYHFPTMFVVYYLVSHHYLPYYSRNTSSHRHMVSDKSQVRATGPVTAITRQPVKGRKKHGGIRLGEMERDALLSHGVAFCLQDR